MPKTTWVKNVYSMGTDGVVNGAQSYTGTVAYFPSLALPGVKPQLFTHLISKFPPLLYTRISAILYLLNIHLYTLSTAPIITKTKEK